MGVPPALTPKSDNRVSSVFPGKKQSEGGSYIKEIEDSLVVCPVKHKTSNGDIKTTELWVPRPIADNTYNAFLSILEDGYARINRVSGGNAAGFANYRKSGKTKDGGFSMHCWGLAFDINSGGGVNTSGLTNWDESDTPEKIRTNNHPVVQILNKSGWFWGGWFQSGSDRYDTMHFQWNAGQPVTDGKAFDSAPIASTQITGTHEYGNGTIIDGSSNQNGGVNTVVGASYASSVAPYQEVTWKPPVQGGSIAMSESISKMGKIGMVLGIHMNQKNLYGKKTAKKIVEDEVNKKEETPDSK